MKTPRAAITTTTTWLTKLKAAELHRLAVRIGTPCSGTKATQIEGIRDALSRLPSKLAVESSSSMTDPLGNSRRVEARAGGFEVVSLISIDMGIRNLAYSHWHTHVRPATAKGEPAQFARPVLQTWRKLDVSSGSLTTIGTTTRKRKKSGATADQSDNESKRLKESFEPLDYAARAFDFIRTVLDEHQPSHVLIERQRFRSGGYSAVQEWTIRVGVFEGMLYAVLKAMAEQHHRYSGLSVEPMLPARVNRYWLGDGGHGEKTDSENPKSKMSGRAVKQAKIDLVRRLLEDASDASPDALFTVSNSVLDVVSTFVDKKTAHDKKDARRIVRSTTNKPAVLDASKLDDLADCLLQGLAWFHWQNNRLKLQAFKEDAYPLMT